MISKMINGICFYIAWDPWIITHLWALTLPFITKLIHMCLFCFCIFRMSYMNLHKFCMCLFWMSYMNLWEFRLCLFCMFVFFVCSICTYNDMYQQEVLCICIICPTWIYENFVCVYFPFCMSYMNLLQQKKAGNS